MRLLLDTNILARAAGRPHGPAWELLEIVLSADHTLITSDYLLAELLRVLQYDRVRAIHGLSTPQIKEYVATIREGSFVASVPTVVSRIVQADADDDQIVAAAIFGQADILCTRDHHFFEEDVLRHINRLGINVLRDTELLSRLRKRRAA